MIHSKYEKENIKDTEVIDTIKQKLRIQSERMRRYKTSNERKQHNRKFLNNEKYFYNQIREDEIKIHEAPTKEALEEYWGSLWTQSKQHTEDAEWTEQMEAQAEK